MDRDQELRREEEIRFVRLEAMLDGVEVDPVQDDIEVAVVRFDLRIRLALKGRLDDQLVEAEDVAKHRAVSVGRFRHIRPHHGAAVARRQPRRVEAVDQLGATASVDEVPNQSPTLTLSAACAAASRATGTRYGEQLT